MADTIKMIEAVALLAVTFFVIPNLIRDGLARALPAWREQKRTNLALVLFFAWVPIVAWIWDRIFVS